MTVMNIREPISTVTNLIFGLVGLGGWAIATSPYEGTLFAVCFVGLMLASAWYHWSLTRDAEAADEIGIYVAYSSILVTCFPIPFGYQIAIMVVILAAGHAFYHVFDSHVVTPALVVAVIAVASPSWAWAGVLLVGFLTSVVLQFTASHYKNERNAPLHDIFHGGWHIVAGVWSFVAFAGGQGLLPPFSAIL